MRAIIKNLVAVVAFFLVNACTTVDLNGGKYTGKNLSQNETVLPSEQYKQCLDKLAKKVVAVCEETVVTPSGKKYHFKAGGSDALQYYPQGVGGGVGGWVNGEPRITHTRSVPPEGVTTEDQIFHVLSGQQDQIEDLQQNAAAQDAAMRP